LNYKIDAPLFSGQTKEKLVDERVKGTCYNECIVHFTKFWNENKSMAKAIVDRAVLIRSKTADFLKDKGLVKNVNAARKSVATKLAPVVGNAPVEKRELFIVEGDSAGGGLKRARDKSYQAVYPMRGKPLNVMEAPKDKINNNAEVVGLLAGLGVDLSGKKSAAPIQYGKVVSMADPDVDGKHIVCLTLGILWKYMPHLFKQGNVYVVKAPLYKGTYKGKVFFGMNKEDLFKKMGTDKGDVTYVKGWGEINEEDLKVAIDPEFRTLYKVLPPPTSEAREFELLMGKKPEYRKKLLNVE
jgi:DNA gyrase/topoisomerase IV subunit B